MARGATSIQKVQLQVATAQGAGDTTQPTADEDFFTPNEAIRPPLNPDYLANLTSIAPLRRSCIAAVVLNTVGLGVELRPREGEEGSREGKPEEVLKLLDECARRDTVLGRPNFKQLLAAAKWDEQEVGTGAIEVSRNTITGEIDGFFHVQGKRVRRRKDRKGWIIGPRKRSSSDEVLRYYEFGDKVQYGDDGQPTGTLQPGRNWATNELIVFRLFTSASRDYGLPPDYALASDYLGDKLAARTNIGYFDNSGVPPTVIFVQGKETEDGEGGVEIEVGPQFVQQIVASIKTGQPGSKVAVVPVPPGTKTEAHNLAVLSERDLGHVQFRADNRRRTLGAWRLSPIFVADIEDAGKYTAEVERAITKEQVFDPEQERWADALDAHVLHEIAPHLELHFREIAIKGDEARRESAESLADRGKITNLEYREAHGYGPMPEAEPESAPPSDDTKPDDTEDPVPDAKPGNDFDALSDEDRLAGKVPKGWNAQLVDPTDKAASLNPFATQPLPEELAKASPGGILEGEIGEIFDRSLDEAVRTISSMTDDGEIRPLIIEKTADDRVLVRPVDRAELNGAGS